MRNRDSDLSRGIFVSLYYFMCVLLAFYLIFAKPGEGYS